MSPNKKEFLRKLGYTEARIKQLEIEEMKAKVKESPIMEMVYKQVASGATPKPNAIAELITQRLQGKEATPTHAERLGAAYGARPPFLQRLVDLAQS